MNEFICSDHRGGSWRGQDRAETRAGTKHHIILIVRATCGAGWVARITARMAKSLGFIFRARFNHFLFESRFPCVIPSGLYFLHKTH